MFSVAASAHIGVKLARMTPAVYRAISYLRRRRVNARVASELLGVDQGEACTYCVGAGYPSTAGAVSADDASAFAHVAGLRLATFLERGWLETPSTINTDLRSNLVLIGAPGPENFSRLVFGYELDPATGTLRHVGGVLDLPFRWEGDRAKVFGSSLRYHADGSLVRRRNWHVVDSRQGLHMPLVPETGNDGFLRSDYLLVTRLPNFLTADGLHHGRVIVSLGGTHGVGTRAVSLLLNQPELVERFLHEIDTKGAYFQALLEARSIVHNPKFGSRAGSLVLRHFVPLAFTNGQLREARRVVSGRYVEWARQGDPHLRRRVRQFHEADVEPIP